MSNSWCAIHTLYIRVKAYLFDITLHFVVFDDKLVVASNGCPKRKGVPMPTEQATRKYVSKTEAQRQLGISRTKLDAVIEQFEIKTKYDPRDNRVRLVNLDELQRLLTRPD